MKVELSKEALDIGLVTHNGTSMLGFYSLILGFEKVGEVPFPGLGTVNKFNCGLSQIKILVLENPPQNENIRGNFTASSGYRYCTLNVRNLLDIVEGCSTNNHIIQTLPREIREGVTVAIIEDPDGNLIELMQDDNL
jgi:catechol 2,3-dioxygenase-like lactoylglutathione lyase family enzyme